MRGSIFFHPRPGRIRGLRVLPLLCAGLVMLGMIAPARAQTILYQETFDNGNATPTGTPILITNYTGPAPNSITYTADPSFLTLCDGWVASWNSPATATGTPNAAAAIASCGGQSPWNYAQSYPQALGVYQGQAISTTARNNLAITATTSGAAVVGAIVIQNTTPIALTGIPPGGTGRFVTLSLLVGVSSNNCTGQAGQPVPPLLRFYTVNGATETQLGTAGVNINPCTAGLNPQTITVQQRTNLSGAFPIRVATLFPSGAGANALYTSPITLRVRDFQGSGTGNDFTFDNFTFVDVSPALTKAVDGIDYIGQTKRLTFTVTNTPQDNQAKTGWAFTETLPAGVTIAATPNIAVGGTAGCTATTSAAAGGSTLTVTNGNLPGGVAGGTATSCTIAVDVVSTTAGVYNNVVNNGDAAVDNITSSTGLNLAVQTVPMEWVVNRLTLTKVSTGNTGSFAFSGNNGIADHTIVTTAPGLPGTAGPQQTLTVASTTANTTVTEAPPPGWAITAVACTGLAAGQAATFAGNGVTIPFAGLSIVSGGRDVACTITNTLSSNLTITKSNTYTAAQPSDLPGDTVAAGANTTYTLVVTNAGPGTVTGAVVRDAPGAGITCPAGNAVTITGDGVPAGSFNIGQLTSAAGIALGTLNVGQSTTLSFTCTVN